MSLRLTHLQAMRPDVTDGMASVRESAERVAAVTRELSAGVAPEEKRDDEQHGDDRVADELPEGSPAGG